MFAALCRSLWYIPSANTAFLNASFFAWRGAAFATGIQTSSPTSTWVVRWARWFSWSCFGWSASRHFRTVQPIIFWWSILYPILYPSLNTVMQNLCQFNFYFIFNVLIKFKMYKLGRISLDGCFWFSLFSIQCKNYSGTHIAWATSLQLVRHWYKSLSINEPLREPFSLYLGLVIKLEVLHAGLKGVLTQDAYRHTGDDRKEI